jgi:serine O-acetyltransferase
MRLIVGPAQAIKSLIIRSLLMGLCHQAGPKVQEILALDIKRWPSPCSAFVERVENLFLAFPEFRSLFFYRIKVRNLRTVLLKRALPPMPTLFIGTPDIGPGLFLQHAFATIISAKTIGRNCWINQQVTIGYTDDINTPVIGDDVTIGAGALVLGGILVGDRVKIGAGAVVVKSVPPDCTVVGNPAYVVRRNGVRVTEKL